MTIIPMPTISNKKKKFIKKNFKKLSIEELVRQTGLAPSVIKSVLNHYNTEKKTKDGETAKSRTSFQAPFDRQSIKLLLVWAIALFIITLVFYIPALNNDFVNWDDSKYIYQNKNIHFLNFHSFYWMLTTFYASNWHPLTWFSHSLDYALWGLNPFGHHLTNVILHGFNALLVFLLTIMLSAIVLDNTGIPSKTKIPKRLPAQAFLIAGVTSSLFGLHPLHVESVAWISERKDLLSALFFLLSILSYLSYNSFTVDKRPKWFVLSILFLALALMAKPMAVSLPLVLLLIDCYPLKRLNQPDQQLLLLVKEKIPFFVLSTVSAVITIVAQYTGGAVGSMEQFPFGLRLLNAARSLLFYLGKMIYPFRLSPFYPFPEDAHWLDLPYLVSGIAIVTITFSCLWMVKRKKYFIPVLWFYLIVTLLPVIGLIQVGIQAAADRYTYLPALAVFLLAGIGISWIYQKAALTRHSGFLKGTIVTAACTILFLLGQLTIHYIKVWQNSGTLWSYVIALFPNRVAIAHNNLGLFYHEKDMLEKALSEYKQAAIIDPDYTNAFNNLGVVYDEMDNLEEAIIAFNKALIIDPHYTEAYYNLGNAYAARGMGEEARFNFKRALITNPHYAEAYNYLGLTCAMQGKIDEAISAYKQAILNDPYFPGAHNNLGNAYVVKGLREKAITEYKRALVIKPTFVRALTNLGITYGELKKLEESIEILKKALALKHDDPEIHSNLAASYYLQGNYTQARFHCNKALALGYSVNKKLLELLKISPQGHGSHRQ